VNTSSPLTAALDVFDQQHGTTLIVDGHNLIYRAFHAFPPTLTTADGTPVNAVFGFLKLLITAATQQHVQHILVTFDESEDTFRSKEYPAYKAHRSPMPDLLRPQIPLAKELVAALNLPIYSVGGWEADDLMATLAHQLPGPVRILSGDQDLVQLVTNSIFVLLPDRTGGVQLMTPESVQEKYGFAPEAMITYKGLRGDPSDNLPGVPGIGEVTAKQLIAQADTLDALYEQLDQLEMKPRIRELLRDKEADARLSARLATISDQAPVSIPNPLTRWEGIPESARELLQQLGFKSFLKTGAGATPPPLPSAPEDTDDSVAAKLDASIDPILRQIENHGVMVDGDYLQQLETEFGERLATLKGEATDLAGQPFNLNAPAQLATILYEVLQVPTAGIKKGKSGSYTTDAETLQQLAPTVPLAATILQFRELDKLQSTYVKPLQELIDEHSRIHTSYAPDTATGRISSRHPNLQNIPIRTEEGKRIRGAFVAPNGSVLVSADYSQIELRLAAELSGDENLRRVFTEDRDIHTAVAESVGVDRRTAKVINFSILYGTSAYGLAKTLEVPVHAAQEAIDRYYETYPQLKSYLDNIRLQVRENGFLVSESGRIRRWPTIIAGGVPAAVKQAAEREAINFPIQSAAADLLKRAMVGMTSWLNEHPDMGSMILTVHDELVLEVPEDRTEEAARALSHAMLTASTYATPIKVEAKSGNRWSELTPLTLES
jgi:5'-3' exonuclease